jgi:hypothetical protein
MANAFTWVSWMLPLAAVRAPDVESPPRRPSKGGSPTADVIGGAGGEADPLKGQNATNSASSSGNPKRKRQGAASGRRESYEKGALGRRPLTGSPHDLYKTAR